MVHRRNAGRRLTGFTLLELLVVSIIISILASIALPPYLRVAERSRAVEALAVLAALRSGELRARAKDPSSLYALSLDQLDVGIPGFAGAPPSSLWTYDVSGPTPGSDGVATRLTGTYAGKMVRIDLDGGKVCATDPVYGLPVVAGDCQ